MINLREKLTLGAIEVAIINEEQFVIKRKNVNIIEIVAIIPTLIDNLRARLSNSSLDVCSIDGHQKVVKRDGPNFIEILSDIAPIDRAVTSHTSTSTSEPSVSIQPTAAIDTVNRKKFKSPADTSAKPNLSNLAPNAPMANLCRYFIFT